MIDDDFDFTRTSGLTDSSGTGPMFDHTLGTTSGMSLHSPSQISLLLFCY